MEEAAKTINAKFVLALGDNFYNDGVSSVDSIRFNVSNQLKQTSHKILETKFHD